VAAREQKTMQIRLSNSNGTIEASGQSNEIATVLSVYSDKILYLPLTDAESEAIRSGDPLEQVEREEVREVDALCPDRSPGRKKNPDRSSGKSGHPRAD
jgi:hypothetical protein